MRKYIYDDALDYGDAIDVIQNAAARIRTILYLEARNLYDDNKGDLSPEEAFVDAFDEFYAKWPKPIVCRRRDTKDKRQKEAEEEIEKLKTLLREAEERREND